MFTGLIEEIGTIQRVTDKNGAKEFSIKASFVSELKIGDSIAINGACQSVTKIENNVFSVFSMPESLNRTNLKHLKAGNMVNLERAMILGSRLDGHIVQGHIDATAVFKSSRSEIFEFGYPTKYLIQKGSIAINGISLTISHLGDKSFCVSVIPQTLDDTTLKFLKTGDLVNIEIDMFAKYIEKFLSANHNEIRKSRLSEEFLKENGF